MSLAIVHSRAIIGITAPSVRIEVHIARGLPSFYLVGLPEKVVKESKDRVRSAIINSGFDFPMQRIVVNLAPAELPKEGGRFDLAIAIGILAASRQLNAANTSKIEFAGELSLSGMIRSVSGILIFAAATEKAHNTLFFPYEDKEVINNLSVLTAYPADSLHSVFLHLSKITSLPHLVLKSTQANFTAVKQKSAYDFSQIKGQKIAKRALEIAAAGHHPVLLNGPPGVGKSLLARSLPSILAPLRKKESLELALLHAASGANHFPFLGIRPFRAPHHSISSYGLVGGGAPPQPGEISLAHRGVLFLDEVAEFSRGTLENLREPLETGAITIARLGYSVTFPAQCLLIVAMNPCPCGYFDQEGNRCMCTLPQIQRYQSRLSGPFLERIDLHVSVQPLSTQCLLKTDYSAESSEVILSRVRKAQSFSLLEQQNEKVENFDRYLEKHLPKQHKQYFEKIIDHFALSARSYYKLLRVARTIANLSASHHIEVSHIEEALCFMPKPLHHTYKA